MIALGGYEDGETRYISLDLSTLETSGDVSAHGPGGYLDLRPKEVVTGAGSHQGAEMYLTSGGHPVESLHTDTYYGMLNAYTSFIISMILILDGNSEIGGPHMD